jgi:YD repeat-containing protein
MHPEFTARNQIGKIWLESRRVLLILALGAGAALVAQAQDAQTIVKSKYFSVQSIIAADGTSLEKTTISGPPTPPPGFEIQRQAVTLPPRNTSGPRVLSDVPAFNWVFGCSSVSGAMIAGYYDRTGYPNVYVGPTNGGVMPMDNSSWPTWTDSNGDLYPNCPLIASKQGVDGRTTKGSINDYWIKYNSTANDPYITGGWAQHAWGTAIGDYMKTSQSAYGNTDGSTTFYNYNSADQLTSTDMETLVNDKGIHISTLDGTYGRKRFYEARGYTVTTCYNQQTDNNIAGGFSFAQYMAEIDAGRPVMLNLEGHTIVGVGYDTSGNTVYIHDTWDYLTHTMTWGGSYSGMQLLSVSIVNLAPNESPTFGTQPSNQTVTAPATATFSADASGTPTYQWQVSTNSGSTWANVTTGTGGTTANYTTPITSLAMNGRWYRVVAHNTGGSTSSDPATLTVNTVPTITTQPVARTVMNSATATFSVVATGNPTPTYEWQVSPNNTDWSTATTGTGGDTATYSLTTSSSDDHTWYRVHVVNGYGDVYSNSVLLTVHVPASITTPPSDATVTNPTKAIFTVVPAGTPPFTYQWRVSTNGGTTWTAVTTGTGGTSATYTTPATSLAMQNYKYSAVVRNAWGSAFSPAATLTVEAKPFITTQPVAKTVTASATTSTPVTFSVVAKGYPALTYQWQVSTNGGTIWDNITSGTGYTTATYSFPAVPGDNGKKFRVYIENTKGTVPSNAVLLTVHEAASITTPPADVTVTAPAKATFTVVAGGPGPFTYQWQVSTNGGSTWANVTSGTGGLTASFTTPATWSGMSRKYRVIVRNTWGGGPSAPATLTVN